MGRLFGTNGVRGIFEKDLTLEFITDLTLSIATYFKDSNSNKLGNNNSNNNSSNSNNDPTDTVITVLVGYDGRDSSPIIARTVCSALNYAGIDCKNAGLVPTPCLEYATKKLGYDGGIMITASHNPPEYNGIKPVAADGVEISRDDELVIEDIYFQKEWQQNNNNPATTITTTTTAEDRAIPVYIDGIKSHLDHELIKSKKMRVVLDVGNGAQAVVAPALCNDLGCETIVINQKIDGSFPGRGSEPTPDNLSDLSNCVKNNNADFGIAFDGDGDRSIFCDDQGKILTGDKSALLLSDYILHKRPRSKIVTCLNSGSSIETIAERYDSKVIRTKVGSVEVSRAMVPIDALIGFEENGGFMYGAHNYVRDGAMTLGLMLELLATHYDNSNNNNSNSSLSEIAEKKLPPSFTTKDKIACSKEQAELLITTLKSEYPSAETKDGIKIVFDDDKRNWIMVRPSGTEPIVRIYGESDSQQKLDSLMAEYVSKVRHIISR